MSNGVNSDVNERPFGHAPGHSRHDRLLVVRFAAGDTTGVETVDGRRLVEQCTDCAAMAADIRQLRTSLAALPAAKRTRNFRLTTDDAERLRGSAFDRFLRRLTLPSLAYVRPVAGVALALGLTITVVGAGLPGSFLPQAASAPAIGAPAPASDNSGGTSFESATDRENQPGAGGSPAAAFATTEPAQNGGTAAAASPPRVPLATTTDDRTATADAVATDAPKSTAESILGPVDHTAPPTKAAEESTDTTRLFLIYGGVTLAMLAFGVLLLTVYARRRTEDPLLR